ncbi:MAG: hypothetical protein VW579_13745 [Verrucomicrobiales bacterium]
MKSNTQVNKRHWSPLWGVEGFGYLILTLIGVPWYWPEDSSLLFAGMPAWVWTSLSASFLASSWTAWIILCRWPESVD